MTLFGRATTHERWQAMARGRIGYAWDKWLWYVTGGATWAGIDVNSYVVAATAVRVFNGSHRAPHAQRLDGRLRHRVRSLVGMGPGRSRASRSTPTSARSATPTFLHPTTVCPAFERDVKMQRVGLALRHELPLQLVHAGGREILS